MAWKGIRSISSISMVGRSDPVAAAHFDLWSAPQAERHRDAARADPVAQVRAELHGAAKRIVRPTVETSDLDPDPLRQMAAWLAAARQAGEPMPEAMSLATATH